MEYQKKIISMVIAVVSVFFLTLLMGLPWTSINNVFATDKIVLKSVPYVVQKERLD